MDNAAPETRWTTLDYVRYGSNRAWLTLRAGLLHQTIALAAGIAAWVWLRDHLAATKYYLGAATPKVIIDKVEPGSTVLRQITSTAVRFIDVPLHGPSHVIGTFPRGMGLENLGAAQSVSDTVMRDIYPWGPLILVALALFAITKTLLVHRLYPREWRQTSPQYDSRHPRGGSMSEADDYPAKCAIRWGMGLVEPLLSVTQRVNNDQAMAELGRTNPTWVRIFFAGVLSNLGGTLPDHDSWRGTSARIGRIAAGPNPPPFDGAVGPDWAPWGTWEDSLDVIESVFSSPDMDPEFAALSEGLLPTAAALVVFSTHGWRLCREALEAVGKTTAGPEEFHQMATSAIRWVAHRRRSYGFPNNDPFLIESFLSWSWRATDVLAGRPVNQEEVGKAIRSERIKTDTL